MASIPNSSLEVDRTYFNGRVSPNALDIPFDHELKQEMAHVARALEGLPTLRRASDEARVNCSRVRELVRIVTRENEAAWVERSGQVTTRRLEQEVDFVLRRADLIESGVITIKDRQELYAVLPAGENLVRSASALEESARGAGEQEEETPGKSVSVSFSMEADAAAFFFESLDHMRALQGAHLRDWECVDRFLDAFFAAHQWKDPNRYALNHKVFERDGWQCSVPGCRSRQRLHAHHTEFRSRGGRDEADNLSAICSAHHLRATHEGMIVVRGRAPDRLAWWLGVRSDGPSLMVVRSGEQIVSRKTTYRKWGPGRAFGS